MDKCIEQAERYLAIREHNENELIVKLKGKSFSQEEIDNALSYLKEHNELNEERYVYSFIRSNNRKHPEGKSVVLMRLLSKQTDSATAKRIVDEVYNDPDYVNDLLTKAYERILRHNQNKNNQEVISKLLKLGFTLSEIKRFLSEKD